MLTGPDLSQILGRAFPGELTTLDAAGRVAVASFVKRSFLTVPSHIILDKLGRIPLA